MNKPKVMDLERRLRSFKPKRETNTEELARIRALSDDALETLIVLMEGIRSLAPVDPWPELGDVTDYWKRSELFKGLHSLTQGQVQRLTLAIEDFQLGKPPISEDVFMDRVKIILHGATVEA